MAIARPFLLVIALVTARAGSLLAGQNVWTLGGPPGQVTAIATDRSFARGFPLKSCGPAGCSVTLYAVTAEGFWRSEDVGETWSLVNVQMSSPRINAIAADPVWPGRVIGVGCGAYESSDGGLTWVSIARGLPEGCPLERVDIDPYRPERLFASGPSGLFVIDFDIVGVSWRPSGRGLFDGRVVVAAHPYTYFGVGRLFAAPESGGFFVSEDWGISWSPIPGGLAGAQVHELSSYGASELWAVTSKGFFWSRDAGRTWVPGQPQTPDLEVNSHILLYRVSYAATDAGVFRNQEGGWKPFSDGLPPGVGIARILTSDSGRVLCAVPEEGPGVFVYRYGNPTVRLRSPTGTVLAGLGTGLTLEVSPAQPDTAIPITIESSDPQTLFPEPPNFYQAFATVLGSPVFVVRAADHPVTVRARVPEQFGGSEDSVTVLVLNPVPERLSLSPQTVVAGGPSFKLTIAGENSGRVFVERSTVLWNGSPRPTTIRSGSVCADICVIFLEAIISAEDIASPGTATIAVRTPPPGGGTSNGVTLTIAPASRKRPTRKVVFHDLLVKRPVGPRN